MEHGGRISCCKTLVVAPWQGRRQERGRGAAAPPPIFGPDQLTQIQQDGGRFCPPNYYLTPMDCHTFLRPCLVAAGLKNIIAGAAVFHKRNGFLLMLLS